MSAPRRWRSAVRCAGIAAVTIIVVAVGAAPGAAQVWNPPASRPDTTRVRPELRLDYLVADRQALHVAAGISVPAGTYARFGAVVGAGPGWGRGGGAYPSVRADLIGRFMIDPFRLSAWGVSMGGGISARHDLAGVRALALLVADVEGPGRRGWIPFAGLGIGGGVRLSAGVRRAATTGR